MVENIVFRKAQIEDLMLYYNWVNDISVRNYAISTDPILLENHKEWFSNKIKSENTVMYVFFEDEIAIGQVRFDIDKDAAYIDYSVDSQFRGKKLGIKILNKGIESFLNEMDSNKFKNSIIGIVKTENIPSNKVFLRLGFELKKQKTIKTKLYSIFTLNV